MNVLGWHRTLARRKEPTKKYGDIYYRPPVGKKLRSMKEISDYRQFLLLLFTRILPHFAIDRIPRINSYSSERLTLVSKLFTILRKFRILVYDVISQLRYRYGIFSVGIFDDLKMAVLSVEKNPQPGVGIENFCFTDIPLHHASETITNPNT